MLPVVINILLAIHVLVSLFIVLLVLMQRPKNEGLGAAFGGGMTDNLFGAQTTNVLQTLTRWLGGLFFALTLLLSFLYVKQTAQKSGVQKRLSEAPPVVATPAPEAPTAASQPVQVGDVPAVPAVDGKVAPVPAEPAAKPDAAPMPPAADPAKPAPSPAPAPAEAAKPADPIKPALAPAPEAPAAKPAEAPAPAEPPKN